MRAAEFQRLGDEIYVDHAAATLPSEKQLQDVFKVTAAACDIRAPLSAVIPAESQSEGLFGRLHSLQCHVTF